MANQDQPQDFEEFDAVTNDDVIDPVDTDFSDTDTEGGFNTASTSRKKRQTVFYLVLALMLIFGGVSAWYLFMRQPDAATSAIPPMTSAAPVADNTAAAPAPMPAAEQPTAAAASDAPNNALPPGITPQDMASASEGSTTPPAMPPTATAPIPPVDAVTPPANDAAIAPVPEMPATATAATAPAPAPANGTTVEALTPPTSPPDMSGSAAPVQNADNNVIKPTLPESMVPAETAPVAVAASNGNIDQRLSQLEQQIQSLTSDLNAARSANAAKPANENTADTSAMTNQIQDLNAKLDRMTQQIESLDQRTTSFATQMQNKASAPAASASSSDTSEPAAAPAPAAKAAVKKPAAAKPEAKKAAVSGNWQLRSAQPDGAWLGRLGSEDMARYTVGQNVPGLGTIQEISQEGGRWIVKTTGGTLRQ